MRLLPAFFFTVALAAPALANTPGGRLNLVMVEEDGCRYCELWHQEVGTSFAVTKEGRQAPLIRLDIKSAAAQRFTRVVYTPTFILVRSDGWEVGRIIGYPGAEHFWGEFRKLLAKAGVGQDQEPPPPGVTPALYGRALSGSH